jgi:hypothetical protein
VRFVVLCFRRDLPTILAGRAKKQRLSMLITDDDDDDEEVVEMKTSFSKRLSNFKKSPAKRGAHISIFPWLPVQLSFIW